MNNQPNNYNAVMGSLKIFDAALNLNQVSNDTILGELQKQNKEYLEKIVQQNETIIEQNNMLETKLNGIWDLGIEIRKDTEELLKRSVE